MRHFYLIFSLAILATKIFSQTGIVENTFNGFSKLNYNKIVVFNYNYDSLKHQKTFSNPIPINENNIKHLKKCSIRTISKEQENRLVKIVTDTATYGQNYADCFEPRHCFAFYNDTKLVFLIEICFDCNYLIASKPLKAAHAKYYDIDGLTDEKGKEYFHRRYLMGFSISGFKKFQTLCRDLNMLYCPEDKEE